MHDAKDHLLACIPRLRRYARALTGDRSRADDLVQDTVERGWDKLATWQRGSDMRAWLFSIMHNVHVDQLRKPVLRTELLDEHTPIPHAANSPTAGLELRDMQSALQQLSNDQREILLLVALEQMTYSEVATSLQLPLGTVMSRLSRARENLRAIAEGRTIVSPLKVVK